LGDTVDGSWYFKLLREGRSVADIRDKLMFGESNIGDVGHQGHNKAAAMADSDEVCGCNGVTKVKERGALKAAYEEAARHDPLVIAEKGVMGGEYTVGIVGDEVLPIIKIEPATEWYDYEAKYNRDDTKYLCPCGLPEAKEMEIRKGALEAFRILGGRGWGRVDFLMDEEGNHYFLEVNTAPGMTDHSLVPMGARVAGMEYPALVRRVLELAAND
jgi:D-alanine-D-alanine ligase